MSKLMDPSEATRRFMSVIPGRRPVEKLHNGIGQAKSALTNYFNGTTKSSRVLADAKPDDTRSGYMSGYNVGGYRHRHSGSDMKIYELVDEGWKLVYEVRTGDLELPWQKGIFEKKKRESESALLKETGRVIRMGLEDFDRNPIPADTDLNVRSLYARGFEAGYKAAKDKK